MVHGGDTPHASAIGSRERAAADARRDGRTSTAFVGPVTLAERTQRVSQRETREAPREAPSSIVERDRSNPPLIAAASR